MDVALDHTVGVRCTDDVILQSFAVALVRQKVIDGLSEVRRVAHSVREDHSLSLCQKWYLLGEARETSGGSQLR